MTTLSRAEDMKVTFTVVRNNDANSEEKEETKVHTFAGRATFDDLKTAVGEWFGTSQSFTLGFSDEDSDFAVIAAQDEWDECLRLHSDAANEVNVLVRVAENDDAAEACRKNCAVVPHHHHHHHHGKGHGGKGNGKGTKRGRSCFERGTKPTHASDEAEADCTTDEEPCKRSRHHGHGSWKGGKGMHGCFGSDSEFAFACKGMKGKGKGKGCRGMKGCDSEDDDECLDMPWKGMKGMKGKGGCKGMKGMLKGMKGMCKGMKGCSDHDDADMPVEKCDVAVDTTAEQEEPSFASWKGCKGALMMMLMKGMKDSSDRVPEVDGQLHENDDEACPPFKGGKGALMVMMKGKGMKGCKGGKKGGKAHGEHRCMRGHAGKKGGKFGMHMHGMKGGHRAHTVPVRGPAF